jgi:arylsulfatase A-like enzyme
VLFASDDDLWGAYELSAKHGPVTQPNHIRTIRTPRSKLSRYEDPNELHPLEYELYDLKKDPDEMTNLAQAEGYQTQVRRLDRQLKALLKRKYEHTTYEFDPPNSSRRQQKRLPSVSP